MTNALSPMKAIRAKCLDCSGTAKVVKYCTADGINSTPCPLWLFRFGRRPATAAARFGKEFLSPGELPPASVLLESLP